MKQGLDLNSLTHSTGKFFQKLLKFHYVVSITLLVVGVAFTTYYINSILSNPATDASTSQSSTFSDKFDTVTIKKVDKFKYSTETTKLDQPSGRINPFKD